VTGCAAASYARPMYEIAAVVGQWQADGVPVNVARVVEVRGISSRTEVDVVAAATGWPQVGSLLSGAIDGQLASILDQSAPTRLVELAVADAQAHRVGLSCGGLVRLIVGPANDLPAQLWSRLAAREPLCLVTALRGAEVGASTLYTGRTIADAGRDIERLFHAGLSRTAMTDDAVVTTLWPIPNLVIVGVGTIADALVAVAGLLGWAPTVVNDADTAVAAIAQLSRADGVVVLSHSRDVDGPALQAALGGRPGYIGALGSRHTQQARAQWLTAHAIADLTPIHGPAGLDIGARTPAEIALAIVAEMLAARSGATQRSLRDRGGPIHG
jgi:xanthine dehydrogenase accessory factor